MGKEEIACYKQFLLFPQCFLLNQKIVSPFVNINDKIPLFAGELEEPKIGMWGKGLNSILFKLLAEAWDRMVCTPAQDLPKTKLVT